MRVGIVNPFPLSYWGGVETVLSFLNSELVRRGVETEVICLSKTEMDVIPKFARMPISAILLKRLLGSKSRFDVIHANGWSSCILKFIRDKPTLVTAHGTSQGFIDRTRDVASLPSRIYTPLVTVNLERIGFNSARQVAAVSNSCKSELIENYQISEDKITIIHNGIDMKEIHKVKSNLKDELGCEHLLLFIGRLAKQKGIDVLIRAIPMLKDYDVKLVVAGTGPEQANLSRLISELNLQEKVVFVGVVHGKRKLEYLSASDIFVFPSLSESFGMVLLEAMACKTPIVASKVAGIPEVIGRDGVLVEPRNPAKLSEGIRELLDDEKTAKKLASRAYKRLTQNFTVERTAAAYIELYERLCH